MMENSRKTSSVIAKLMGLDETPPRQQSVSKQERVFSEDYRRKSGSIGKRSRKDLQNCLLGSKKRANLRTNKDALSRDLEQKSLHFDGMQGFKLPVSNVEKGKLPKKIVVLRPNIGKVQHGSLPSFLLDSQSVFAWEAKKQLLERNKMTKGSQPDFVNSVGIKSNYESVAKLPIFKAFNISSNLNTKSVKSCRRDTAINTKKCLLVSNSSSPFTDAEPGAKNVVSFHGDTKDRSNCSMKEDSPIRSLEDGSSPSNCIRIDGENSDGKVEMHQHSPNSVLETPFREDSSSSSECFETTKTDLNSLWMQLHLLKSELAENDNKPETVTWSDDERSTSTDQNAVSTILSGSKEMRESSYLVDVLNESAFKYGNVEIRFEQWHSSERMGSLSVFETLEKKYGKQELWHISERKLLFDRINLGMMEIVRPQVDIRACSKPLRRKMRSMLRRDVIEEELSALLLSQEKGVNDGVSEKAVGRGLWIDPVDELDCIVKEIEIFLFDELAEELVSTLEW